MIRYINSFKKKNRIKYKEYFTENKILICDRGRPGQTYFNALFSLHINKKKKLTFLYYQRKKVNLNIIKNFSKLLVLKISIIFI